MFFDVSKVDVIKCKIEWKLYNLEIFKEYMNKDQFLTSKQFYNPKCPSVVWEMRVYPNTFFVPPIGHYGSIQDSGVSIIQKGLLNSKLKVKYNIYVINANCERINIKSDKSEFTKETETDKYKINVQKILHSDDSVLLYCEIEFVPYNIKCVENLFGCPGTTNQKSLSNMYKQGILTDCVIKIGNEKINAHRCVMANNSVVFQKMFEQKEMLEAKNGEINIVDCSQECFHAMLDYFYNGEINKEILEKLAYELFAIAHKYEVKSLMDKCEYIIADKIDVTNYIENLKYLLLYNLPVLEKACVKYIAANRMIFLDSNEWKHLKEKYKDKANNLLESALKNEF